MTPPAQEGRVWTLWRFKNPKTGSAWGNTWQVATEGQERHLSDSHEVVRVVPESALRESEERAEAAEYERDRTREGAEFLKARVARLTELIEQHEATRIRELAAAGRKSGRHDASASDRRLWDRVAALIDQPRIPGAGRPFAVVEPGEAATYPADQPEREK